MSPATYKAAATSSATTTPRAEAMTADLTGRPNVFGRSPAACERSEQRSGAAASWAASMCSFEDRIEVVLRRVESAPFHLA